MAGGRKDAEKLQFEDWLSLPSGLCLLRAQKQLARQLEVVPDVEV
jgi:hypothetical protein